MSEDDKDQKGAPWWAQVTSWRNPLVLAFGAWAGVVPLSASMVVGSQERQAEQAVALTKEFRDYVLTSEKRMTLFQEQILQLQRDVNRHSIIIESLRDRRPSAGGN